MAHFTAQQHVNMGDGHFLPPGAKVNISEDEARLTNGLQPILERPDDRPVVEQPNNKPSVEAPRNERPWETQEW